MADDGFTVTLDRREGQNVKGFETGSAVLKGKPVNKKGSTGLADSIEAVLDSGLIHVPTYRLIGGRAFAGKDDDIWSHYYESRAERITAYDEKGILGAQGAVYTIDIQNGGLFVWNPQRIREAVNGGKLVDSALQLTPEEIDNLLDAINRKDYNGLKQIVHGGDVAFAGDYKGFLEASKSPDFIKGMDTTYLVVRPEVEAIKHQDVSTNQRYDPDLVIASGGSAPLSRMLEQGGRFGWWQFGPWNYGYQDYNSGRIVWLGFGLYSGGDRGGLVGYVDLDKSGRTVGVAQEALDAFYKKK